MRKASLLVVLLATSMALAQGTYTQIDVPGSIGTAGQGIDTAGDIVGIYAAAIGNSDGFLLSGGTYTTIIYAGATYTSPTGINDKGQIVGTATNLGFLYDIGTQAFTTISRSGASLTLPFGINNAGQISGTLFYGLNQHLGFELIGSKYVLIRPPGLEVVNATGISPSGAVIGYIPGTAHNFLFSHGKYQFLAIPNAPGAEVFGISRAGLVGSYNPSSTVTAGFLYQNKTLTTLQFPGSIFTEALGINSTGEVVGYFVDANSNTHGFTWVP